MEEDYSDSALLCILQGSSLVAIVPLYLSWLRGTLNSLWQQLLHWILEWSWRLAFSALTCAQAYLHRYGTAQWSLSQLDSNYCTLCTDLTLACLSEGILENGPPCAWVWRLKPTTSLLLGTGIWRPIIIRKNIPFTKWVYLVPVYLWGPKKCYPKIFQRVNFEILTDTLIRRSHPMLNENLKMLET